MPKTIDAIGIFWQMKGGQEEVPGLYFYGQWKNSLPERFNENDFKKRWPLGVIEHRLTRFENEEYNVLSVKIYIKEFPPAENWLDIIQRILKWFIEQGAIASWCGAEDCSPNPIILDPNCNDGNVYAFYSPEAGFLCNAALDQELKYLDNLQLARAYQTLS
jgi:hypothetical protein